MKIEVTAQFTATGKIIPLNFNDGKRTHRVHSSGRQWENKLGRHFLVMDVLQKTYHLVFDPQECVWRLASGAQAPTMPI